ncbi:GAF domain-containing protein [Candidatus Gracilibacteria bacterium]|nr:GAF domain-containing protein [Candidatus Gracilibacteria bacterium]
MNSRFAHSVEQSLIDLRTTALLRIASAIETAATLDELLLLALHEFSQLLDIPMCALVMLSEDHSEATLTSVYPPRVSLPPPFPLHETTYLHQMVAMRQPFEFHDVSRDLNGPEATPLTRHLAQLLDNEQVRSMLLVPLVALDRMIGLLVFASLAEPRRFADNEVALARLMAGQLAAAITSFRITEKAQRRSAELATLNDIASAVTSTLDPREVYHLVIEKLNEYFRVDAGSLLMVDEESEDLVFVMTLEAGEEKLAGVRVPRGEGVVGDVAQSQRYAIVHDAQNDPRHYTKVSEDVGYVTHSILAVPMVVKGRTIGVIELLNKRDGTFTEDEAYRLSRMATTIGVAIENARLFQEVANGRDRLEAILNSTNDGILMADMHGTILTANPMAAQLIGEPRDAMIGRRLNQLLAVLAERAAELSAPQWLNEDHDGPSVIEIELPGVQRRFIRHFLLPVRDAFGTLIGQLALFQDISKERELAQLRDDYTGMLIHDLRAPLTAIMNGIMMVKRGLGGPISEQQQELLSIAHQGSQTMLEMVNTLLDISKMEQGAMTIEHQPISPYALVDETVDRLLAKQSQSYQLRQEMAIGLPLFEGDHEKLVRVFQNLLDNAIKFTSNGGDVILGAASARLDRGVAPPALAFKLPDLAPGNWIVFWVRDHGPGIPAQDHDRIFRRFGQVRGRRVRGTGLGLTFCKLAVEAHGGRIWLESKEGEGSTFVFALPLRQPRGTNSAH